MVYKDFEVCHKTEESQHIGMVCLNSLCLPEHYSATATDRHFEVSKILQFIKYITQFLQSISLKLRKKIKRKEE